LACSNSKAGVLNLRLFIFYKKKLGKEEGKNKERKGKKKFLLLIMLVSKL
jgi:hypothetical protein